MCMARHFREKMPFCVSLEALSDIDVLLKVGFFNFNDCFQIDYDVIGCTDMVLVV